MMVLMILLLLLLPVMAAQHLRASLHLVAVVQMHSHLHRPLCTCWRRRPYCIQLWPQHLHEISALLTHLLPRVFGLQSARQQMRMLPCNHRYVALPELLIWCLASILMCAAFFFAFLRVVITVKQMLLLQCRARAKARNLPTVRG
jgi:hypothetical protein